MARVTRALPLLALLFAACDGKTPAAPAAPEPPREKWGSAVVGDFTVHLPLSWGADAHVLGGDGWQFFGPKEGVFKPSLMLYWRPWKHDPAEWASHMEAKFGPGNPLVRVRGRGTATIAGLPARYLVYHQRDKDPTKPGDPIDFLTIDWYFAAPGRGGILRGVATEQTFVWKYRALFERMAGGLRYTPK